MASARPRLTLRELQARRQRAQEGYARFRASFNQYEEEEERRIAMGPDAAWYRQVQEREVEMRAAIALIREGLPGTSLKVGVRVWARDIRHHSSLVPNRTP